MGWWNFPATKSPLETYLTNSTAPKGCLSWYGHRFEKFSETAIYCPICGTTKAVK